MTAIHVFPDGLNINENCGSTHLEDLQAAVLKDGADVGFALDGDADRCLAVDHEGNVVDGDQILAVLALGFLEAGHLAKDTVVATVMSNLGFVQAMRAAGIGVRQTKVGDRYVLEAMKVSGYSLGGEQSGHVIMSEYATTGDGILTALHILERMATTGKSLKELASVMTRLPQVLVNVTDVDKSRTDDDAVLAAAVAEEEAALGDSGRILLRPSGTEPMVRVMVEAATAEEAARDRGAAGRRRPAAAVAVPGLDRRAIFGRCRRSRAPRLDGRDDVRDPGGRPPGREPPPGLVGGRRGGDGRPADRRLDRVGGVPARAPDPAHRRPADPALGARRRRHGRRGDALPVPPRQHPPRRGRGLRPPRPPPSRGRPGPARRAGAARRADGRTVLIGSTFAPVGAESPGLAVRRGQRLPGGEPRGDQGGRPQGGARALGGRSTPRSTTASAAIAWTVFEDHVPDEYVEDFCALLSLFIGEVPTGDLELEDATWTPERLRDNERRGVAIGRVQVIAVAIAPDGTLCGFSDLRINRADPRHAAVGGTLVLPGHRGHRLGLAMKLATHRRLIELFPSCGYVETGNAGVNAAMSAVNERLGYQVVERCFDVQKRL